MMPRWLIGALQRGCFSMKSSRGGISGFGNHRNKNDFFFSQRVLNAWYSVPEKLTGLKSLSTFKAERFADYGI